MRKAREYAGAFFFAFFLVAGLQCFAQTDFDVLYNNGGTGNHIQNDPSLPPPTLPPYDLGSWVVNDTRYYRFTCKNLDGSKDITFNGASDRVQVAGDSEFSRDTDLTSGSLSHGSTRDFIVAFTTPSTVPSTAQKIATITVNYIDTSSVPQTYKFRISSTITGSAVPQISIRIQGGAIVGNGTASGIDFGSRTILTSTASASVIQIENIGSDDLTSLSVSPAAGFSSSALSPSGTTIVKTDPPKTFTITFTPTNRASYAGSAFTVHSNLADYTFTVDGIGTGSEIDVQDSAASSIPSGTGAASTIDFGSVKIGDAPDRAFTIWNMNTGLHIANAALNLSAAVADRAKIMDTTQCFSIPDTAQPPSPTIAIGDHEPFTVTFAPANAVAYSTGIDIADDDPDGSEAPYKIIVKGSGYYQPTASIGTPNSPTATANLFQKPSLTGSWYGQAPMKVNLSPANVQHATKLWWDLNGNTTDGPNLDGFEVSDTTSALATTQSMILDAPTVRTIRLRADDAAGHQSVVATLVINAYPADAASFPRVAGVPFDNSPPIMDGTLSGWDNHADPVGSTTRVYGENGWTKSFNIPFANGTSEDARVDLVRTDSALYFAFYVDGDASLAADDQILIGIGAGPGARQSDQNAVGLITLSPSSAVRPSSAQGTDAASIGVSMKRYDGSNWISESPPLGTSFGASADAGMSQWYAELKIPIGSAGPTWLNLGGTFLLYIRIDKAEPRPGTTVPLAWPRGIPDSVPQAEQRSEWWGLASRDDSLPSNGLSIKGYSAIGVRSDPADTAAPLVSTFKYTPLPSDPPPADWNTKVNTLVAKVTNEAHTYTADPTTGAKIPHPLDATNVRVHFKIANWGIPSIDHANWTDIDPAVSGSQTTANPTGWDSVPADTTKDFTFDWKLSLDQVRKYPGTVTAENGMPQSHQCMLAELETGAGTEVPIVTRSVSRNMNFEAENAGRGFSGKATISAQGLDAFIEDAQTKAGADRKILVRLYARDWKTSKSTLANYDRTRTPAALASRPKEPAAQPRTAVNERLYYEELRTYINAAPATISFTEYIVRAYAYTGRQTQRNGHVLDEVVPLGSYGYVVRHLGSAEGWDIGLNGPNVQKVNDRTYIITLKKDGIGTVTDSIRAIDPPKWSFGLLGGAGYGLPSSGNFTPLGGGGAGLAMFSLEPDEKDQVASLQLLLGYDYFPGSGSSAAWQTPSASLSARFALPLLGDWSRWYCSMGGGVYQDGASAIKLGWALGTGLDFALSHPFHLQLGADFLGTKDGAAMLHFNAGLIYRLIK